MKITPALRLADAPCGLAFCGIFVTSLPALGRAGGHRMVNELALASPLPADFPAFVPEPAAVERIALPSRACRIGGATSSRPARSNRAEAWTDHYYRHRAARGCRARRDQALTPFRYDFVGRPSPSGRAAHAGQIPADRSGERSPTTPRSGRGFLHRGRLSSATSMPAIRLQLPEGSPGLGHTGGDRQRPGRRDLHHGNHWDTMSATARSRCTRPIHHNGWVGPNPERLHRR